MGARGRKVAVVCHGGSINAWLEKNGVDPKKFDAAARSESDGRAAARGSISVVKKG